MPSEPLTPEDLAAIRERLTEATRFLRGKVGLFERKKLVEVDDNGKSLERGQQPAGSMFPFLAQAWDEATAAFLAAAYTDVPRLLAEVERLTKDNELAWQEAEVQGGVVTMSQQAYLDVERQRDATEAALTAERATAQWRLEILQQISREAYITWSNEVRGLKVETLRLVRKEPDTGPWLDREEVDRGS